MARREQPLATEDEAITAFAADLRALRLKAGNPPYRELAARAHYSAASLSEAASGRKLPSLAVTRAYVGACGGDVAEWAARWQSLAADAEPDPLDDATPPYVGLAAFGIEDSDRF